MRDPDCPNCECGGNLCSEHGCGVLGCHVPEEHTHNPVLNEYFHEQQRQRSGYTLDGIFKLR